MSLSKTYTPNQHEESIYALWEDAGAFRPQHRGHKDTYCILMPPPNANGDLHLGHAFMLAVQDLLIRYQRMQGKATLYLPGTDHAGFETQVVYEKRLEAEGASRFDFGRDELYSRIKEFVLANKGNVEDQLRQLGASCDWGRNTFTLDAKIVERVYATFKKMWGDGLIYRGERIVNYCTYHDTSFSELEVEYKDQKSKLWHIRYPIEKGDGEVVVATTRPETMLGDTAVAVHPEDERYQSMVGQVVDLPLVGRPIPIIADAAVDQEFGSGAVKVTPAHDPADFEIGERHELPRVQVIGFDGKITEEAPQPYRGLSVEEARQQVVEDLKEQGFLVEEETHTHRVGTCYKCGTPIEPLLKDQWLLNMEPLAERARSVLEAGDINVVPQSEYKTLMHWLNNIKDWNISRQIAWGVPVPAFQNVDNPDDWIFDTRVEEEIIEHNGATYRRDPDTFDTWFSSGQWPFATLGYPDHEDFKQFYPTDVMETAADILFFWVARMIMFSLYVTDEIPFRTIYLHGLVLDEHGTKMSKSRGNVINPIEVREQYGADALRLGLIAGRSAGLNQAFDPAKVTGGQHFANKLWNAARFTLDTLEKDYTFNGPEPDSYVDKWLWHRLSVTAADVTRHLDEFRFSEAQQAVISLLWDDFADWYIEASKVAINKDLLVYGLATILKLAHPFAPFVTETIWQHLPQSVRAELGGELVITASWPDIETSYSEEAEGFEELQRIIGEVRNLKGQLNIQETALYHRDNKTLAENARLIQQLAGVSEVRAVDEGQGLPLTSTQIESWLGVDHHTIRSYMQDLRRQQEQTERQVSRLAQQLENKQFTKQADPAVVKRSKERHRAAQEQLETLSSQLQKLQELV